MANPWDKYPALTHLRHHPDQRRRLQRRRRQRQVRYRLFRFKTIYEQIDAGGEVHLTEVEKLPGFIEFWLEQKPAYQMGPEGTRTTVDPKRNLTVEALGGYRKFAILWDVDEDLEVYLRHNSVWDEWDARMMARTPILAFKPN